jgi:hypothetical protein
MIENPNGCDMSKLRHKARVGLWYLEALFLSECRSVVVTHTFDGQHKEGSLHFKNRAVDILPPGRENALLLKQAKQNMGKDYDVIDEGDHWHMEYDPK